MSPSLSDYKKRVRDLARMKWIKTLPCAVTFGWWPVELVGDCGGVVEADHAGRHGMSHKAPDNTCIPLCMRHHREPGLNAILYGKVERGDIREFKDFMIDHYQKVYAEQVAAGMILKSGEWRRG